jgi:putative SOS response-associated peptidase YedK
MMAEIHNSKKRMPVILDRSTENIWINLSVKPADALELLKPCPSDYLKAHTISSLVNDRTADRNTPEVIQLFIRGKNNRLF